MRIYTYISFGKEQHNQPLEERFKEADSLPPDPTSVEKVKHRLQTKEGKKIYSERKVRLNLSLGSSNMSWDSDSLCSEALRKQKGNGI